MEDALYEIESMRYFAGLRLGRLLDETTILNFRHFLEQHGLGKALFEEVNQHLEKNGLMLRENRVANHRLSLLSDPPETAASLRRCGYLSIQKRDEHKHREDVTRLIAKRPGTRKKLDADKLKAEKIKASVRAKVEHPFRYIKQVFGYSKVRCRGLAKNNNRLHLLAAFSNLLIGEKYMLA